MTVGRASKAAEVVTDHQRTYFDAYGYVVLPGLFADDVDGISTAFDEVFADAGNPRLEINVVGHRFHSQYAMANFIERHPRLARLTADDRVTGAVAKLLGPGATYLNSDGSIYCCETEWHYDSPMEMPERRHAKVMLYLESLDHGSGAPRVLPASHHDPALYQGPLQPYLGFDGAIEQRTGLRGEDLPSWTLRTDPGDVLVWDFRLFHCSYGSVEQRRQFALNYCAAG